MPLHINISEDGQRAMCFCEHAIGERRADGSIEVGILLSCGHCCGNICLATSVERQSKPLCPYCRDPIPPSAFASMPPPSPTARITDLPIRTTRQPDYDRVRLQLRSQITSGGIHHHDQQYHHPNRQGRVPQRPVGTIKELPTSIRHLFDAHSLRELLGNLHADTFHILAGVRCHATQRIHEHKVAVTLYTQDEVERISSLALALCPDGRDITLGAIGDSIRNKSFGGTREPGHSADPVVPISEILEVLAVVNRPMHRYYDSKLQAFIVRAGAMQSPDGTDAKPINNEYWLELVPPSA